MGEGGASGARNLPMIWEPSRQFAESTNVWRFMRRLGFKDREAFLQFSRENPERFWDQILREMQVEWFTPYRQVMDLSHGPEWARWFQGGTLNIAHNCLDRWASTGRVACIWEGENGAVRTVRFSSLREEANRVANGLRAMGLRSGDRAAVCMPMIPEVLSILYGCFKLGVAVVPIFSGFGTGAIAARLTDSGARVLFTTEDLERRGQRIPLAAKMPGLVERTVVVHGPLFPDQPSEAPTTALDSEHTALLLYTSGTTGGAKGTVHTHAGCVAQMGKEIWLAFDHRDSDRFFWLTDLGWMMGPWSILGNHLFGGTIFLYDGAPDFPGPARLWEMIVRHKITTFGLSPTAIRMLAKAGSEPPPMDSLRLLGSTGEPWDEASWMWFFERIGRRRCPILNISGGTEIVGCFLLPLPIQGLKPCSLGGPAPGMATECVDEEGRPARGRKGYLVCTKPAPSMTRGIWGDPDRYLRSYWSKFPGWWYHGDWASVDEEGHWFLHGRADEAMNVAGRKIGPAEIEAAMMRHPGVAEAAVIGVPDELKGEAIVGYAVPKPGARVDPPSVCARVVEVMGAAFRPREIVIVRELPKTQSGKIVRRLLRSRYLGEPLGDLSTVANPWVLE
jgi:acetyl-CoA synthetase